MDEFEWRREEAMEGIIMSHYSVRHGYNMYAMQDLPEWGRPRQRHTHEFFLLLSCRPLNLPGQFIVRATHFHSEIGLSHSEIPAQSSHNNAKIWRYKA